MNERSPVLETGVEGVDVCPHRAMGASVAFQPSCHSSTSGLGCSAAGCYRELFC